MFLVLVKQALSLPSWVIQMHQNAKMQSRWDSVCLTNHSKAGQISMLSTRSPFSSSHRPSWGYWPRDQRMSKIIGAVSSISPASAVILKLRRIMQVILSIKKQGEAYVTVVLLQQCQSRNFASVKAVSWRNQLEEDSCSRKRYCSWGLCFRDDV